jgi:holin-like protein
MYNLSKMERCGMMYRNFAKRGSNKVKYIFQFARITAFCLAGEVLAVVLPLPIPASVYGLLLMVAALKTGVLKLDQVRETGLFLTGIFPLLFVPAAAGVVELGSQLMDLLLPAVLAIVPITALVMAVTGMVAQKCAGRKEHKNG